MQTPSHFITKPPNLELRVRITKCFTTKIYIKKKNLIYLFLKTILSSTITQKMNFGIQMNISTDFATFLFLFLFFIFYFLLLLLFF